MPSNMRSIDQRFFEIITPSQWPPAQEIRKDFRNNLVKKLKINQIKRLTIKDEYRNAR